MSAALAMRKATRGGRAGGGDSGEANGKNINMTLNPFMLARNNSTGPDADLLSVDLLDSIVEAPNAVQVCCYAR